jgi:hypothetical protein
MKTYQVTFIVTTQVQALTKDEAMDKAIDWINGNADVNLDDIEDIQEIK